MNEILSRAEVEARFSNEWVLMVDLESGWDPNFKGRVVAHSANPDELAEKSKAYRPREIAIFFAGPPFPPGMGHLGFGPRGYLPLDPEIQAAQLKEVQRLRTIPWSALEGTHVRGDDAGGG